MYINSGMVWSEIDINSDSRMSDVSSGLPVCLQGATGDKGDRGGTGMPGFDGMQGTKVT